MFKVHNKGTRTTLNQLLFPLKTIGFMMILGGIELMWHRSGIFVANCEHISHLLLVFLLLTLSR